MSSRLASGLLAGILMVAAVTPAVAQAQDTTRSASASAMDSAFARARQLVVSGQTAAGRRIADSILAAIPPTSPAYGDALYGHAMVAPTAADAERDYQRIIVEYPLSSHSGDALLQLAQIERSQGDRASAVQHLRRFLLENPGSAQRARTGFWLAQLLFEQNEDSSACGVLKGARQSLDPANVELQNQMDFYTTRCQASVARIVADSTARADSIRRDSSERADSVARATAAREEAARKNTESSRKRAEPPRKHSDATPTHARTDEARSASGAYSVQVGAYDTADAARAAVARLHTRGIEARMAGTRKPFRVRIGHYKTRDEASKALAQFRKLGIGGFVAGPDGL